MEIGNSNPAFSSIHLLICEIFDQRKPVEYSTIKSFVNTSRCFDEMRKKKIIAFNCF